MRLEQARICAEVIKSRLAPFCSRIEIAGSVRREKPEPNDIEIVAVLNGQNVMGFLPELRNLGTFLKNGPRYKQILLPAGVKLDLFIATPGNWGLIFAIRTGSAEFSRDVLAAGWCKKGYHSREGVLYSNHGVQHCIREEKDLFDFIGVPWVEPKERN